jgi:glycyl-tRNA synthetase alpha chain
MNFQDIILKLQHYWADNGCNILQLYDENMGAGTFHPATLFGALGKKIQQLLMLNPAKDLKTEDMEKSYE